MSKIYRSFVMFPLLLVLADSALGQAPTVDAGPDQGDINAGDTVTLEGTISGDYTTIAWNNLAGFDLFQNVLDGTKNPATFTAPDRDGWLSLGVSEDDLSSQETIALEWELLVCNFGDCDKDTMVTTINVSSAETSGPSQSPPTPVPAVTPMGLVILLFGIAAIGVYRLRTLV